MHELERAGVEVVNLIDDARTQDNIVEFRPMAVVAGEPALVVEKAGRARGQKA